MKRNSKAWRKKIFPHAGSTNRPVGKDYESPLRQVDNFMAEDAAGVKVLTEHPKIAPDLNLGFVARSPITDTLSRHRVAR